MQRTAALTQLIERNGQPVARRLQKVRVTVLDGADKGAVFEGAQDEIRIGASEDNDLMIRDASVSRRHVALRLTADGVRVIDQGSTNGTFMDDMRVYDLAIYGAQELLFGTVRALVEPLDQTVEKDLSQGVSFGRLVGTGASMREVFAVLERVSTSDLTVMIEGETGTGKELVADAIHRNSPRAGGPFIAIDCGAIPRDLIESELFGHDKGAFTGAVRQRLGAFASADGGTLFLDEVAELPLELQARLLRVLEAREVRAVGSDKTVATDVRVVAATHKNLPREVKEGRFRPDLYYRLAAVVVKLPPLRSRLEDVEILVETIMEDINRRRTAQGVSPYNPLDRRAMHLLNHYDFPGNVRELRNLVERFAVLGPDPSALASMSPAEAQPTGFEIRTDLPFHDAKELWTESFEKTYLTKLLVTHGNNVSAAARSSGIDRRHLQRLMVKHDLRERDGSE